MIRIYRQLLFMSLFTGIILIANAYSADTVLCFRLVHPDNDRLSSLAKAQAKVDTQRYEYFARETEGYWVDRKVELDIHDLRDVKIKVMVKEGGASQWGYIEVTPDTFPSFHFPSSSKPCLVDIYFTEKGRKKMTNVTAKNVGKKLAMVFRGKLLMEPPLIKEKINAEYVTVTRLSIDEATLLRDAVRRSNE